MKSTHKTRVINDAITRLRHIAQSRAIRDQHDIVQYEGYPTPGDIRAELETIYNMARRQAQAEARRKKGTHA